MINSGKSSAQKFSQYADIVFFKAYADLQSERQRTYLGFLWWIFEPLMYMVVMWVVFEKVLQFRTEDAVLFLLVGLVFWQWLKSCISHASNGVLQARPLIVLVPLPPVIFPLSMILTDTFKFILVLAVLLGVLLVTGHAQSEALLALPLVLLAELLLIVAVTLVLAAVIPFFPDLRFIVDNVLLAAMFLSGIFFDPATLTGNMKEYFYYNPSALIIREAREILLHQRWPDWQALLWVSGISILVCLVGAAMLHALRGHYPKQVR